MFRITPKSSRGGERPAILSSARASVTPPALRVIAGLLLTLGAAELRAADFHGNEVASGDIVDESFGFHDQSSAGNVSITLSFYTESGLFDGSSTAANANVRVDNGVFVSFDGQSTAASATLAVDGGSTLEFLSQSTAGAANIHVQNSSYLNFGGQSSAAASTINVEAGSYVEFFDQATAGNAGITVDQESFFYLYDNATLGNARVVVDGRLVMYDSLGSNGDGVHTIGSLAGTGNVQIGGDDEQNNLVVRIGGNGDSTSFNGELFGGAGSTLVKTGTGVFSLDSSASLGGFQSAIVVEQGLIEFASLAGLGFGPVTLDGGGLRWAVGTNADISSRLQPLGPNGGVFDTNGSDVMLQTEISGSGALTKTGAGSLLLMASGPASYTGGTLVEAGTLGGLLPGSTAYTVNGGTLDLSMGSGFTMSSLSGSGGVVLLGSSTLTVDQSASTVYAGEISGGGGLVKAGTGRLNLTGIQTYTGPTSITGGTLAINGSLDPSSSVSVYSGGTLGGNGTVGTVVVYSGGTLAPGNSIGTLHINGDLIFNPGSVFSVETDAAGNADRVIATGMITLDGTLQVLAGSGAYAAATNYPIISTTGSSPISGRFANLTSNLAFLDASLDYTANGVALTMTRNDTTFVSQANTPNQAAFARSLATLDPNSPVYRTILNLSSEQAAYMYSQLSGDAHASVSAALVSSDIDVMNTPLQNLRANLDSPVSVMPMWAQASSGTQRMDDDGNAGATTQDFNGALIGGDLPAIGDWRMGAAIGYDIAQVSVGSREAKGDTKTQRYALYGGRAFERSDDNSLRLFGGVAYSLHTLESTRDVSLIDGPERLTRSYDVVTTQVFAELAYRFGLGEETHVEPFAGLMKVDQRTDAFQEKGGSAALAGDKQHNTLFISTVGARSQHRWNVAGLNLLMKGSLTWRHLDGDVQPELGLRLSGGERYTVLGTELPRDSLLLSLNANYDLAAGVMLNVGFNASASESSSAAALVANLRWKMP